ncbi:MAG: branched-chain amino acid ABC transporter permease [bacterium]
MTSLFLLAQAVPDSASGAGVAYLFQQVLVGLTIGGVYALIAVGYTMVYGIIELINFAHGEIFMIGAFISILALSLFATVGASAALPLALLIAIALAACWSAGYNYTLERTAYKPLRFAPRLAPLISAIGASYFLKEYVRLAAGSQFFSVPSKIQNDPMIAGAFDVGGVSVKYLQIAILISCAILMAAVTLLVNRTRLGKAMRATAQDKIMSQLLGIDVNTIISYTFVMGASLAAAAGLMVSMYYGSVDFNLGFLAGIKAFTAAVLGGIGNIPGAMLGGFVLGLSETLWAGYVSSTYKDVFTFIVLVFVLLFKPSGLLGEQVGQKA